MKLSALASLWLIVVMIIMFVQKVTPSKWWVIAGTVVLIIYAIVTVISRFQRGLYAYLFYDFWGHIGYLFKRPYTYEDLFLFARGLAFFSIILIENNVVLFKKKVSNTIVTLVEDKLVSLKQLYDSGDITEQEYTEKKTEILNKL